MSESECNHEDVEVTEQQWVSGDTIELKVECRYCGKKGTISIDIAPGLVEWDDE